MKTKYWIMLFAGMAVVLAALAVLLIPKGQAQSVEIWSQGKLVQTLDLQMDTTLEIKTESGMNIVTVQDGRAWVSHADCKDHTCMNQGKRSTGQIVCLPNRLVLKFVGGSAVDTISG